MDLSGVCPSGDEESTIFRKVIQLLCPPSLLLRFDPVYSRNASNFFVVPARLLRTSLKLSWRYNGSINQALERVSFEWRLIPRPKWIFARSGLPPIRSPSEGNNDFTTAISMYRRSDVWYVTWCVFGLGGVLKTAFV